ncbi:CheY-like chemotaxis protein [Phyllobacterium ifriqiyense]|uniref:CheY-like chemotaxis protein n=1 Tax=Phyllobacterium ifriqiyense TaxID=314238 RepID=A0ABU0S383_9HYPH|nr:response regulator [Phyllobacterium ifriqiyense]MDQ0995220.1 CheY-like chemotaxis protein [Phyllobacterium ifriqiyense]
MVDPVSVDLEGKRLLVVEDEYLIAIDLAYFLEGLGAEIVGPAGSVEDALELVASHDGLDGAVLDINLRGRRVFPVADALASRNVPFVFTTGYDALVVPDEYESVPRCEKPIDQRLLASLIARLGSER